MGEAKRKADLGITTLHVEITGDVKGNALSNVRVKCDQTGSWLAVATLLLRGLDMAMQSHTKQLFEAGQSRIAKPTGDDIARLA